VVALGRLHVQELHTDPSSGAMANNAAHLQSSRGLIFFDSEVYFDFRSYGKLVFGQDADADGAHVGKESRDELATSSKQHTPIFRVPGSIPSLIVLEIGHIRRPAHKSSKATH